jgi:hypothetical protein
LPSRRIIRKPKALSPRDDVRDCLQRRRSPTTNIEWEELQTNADSKRQPDRDRLQPAIKFGVPIAAGSDMFMTIRDQDRATVSGDFTPVVAKHTKSFNLVDTLSVGVDSFPSLRNAEWCAPSMTCVVAVTLCPLQQPDLVPSLARIGSLN